jgi:hypothetical protein
MVRMMYVYFKAFCIRSCLLFDYWQLSLPSLLRAGISSKIMPPSATINDFSSSIPEVNMVGHLNSAPDHVRFILHGDEVIILTHQMAVRIHWGNYASIYASHSAKF